MAFCSVFRFPIVVHKMRNWQYYARKTHSLVFVTTPDENVAKNLAHQMLKKGMIACANIVPKITSIYSWKNEICEDSEVLIIIKTRTSRVADIVIFVQENHPYTVCETISVHIQEGNKKYIDWINNVVKPF